jgi:hypothetical protein
MNVAVRNSHATMIRNLLDSEGICTRVTESRQKSVAQ